MGKRTSLDPQQFRVYRMEREDIGARDYCRLTWKECARVARSVCRAYGVSHVRLRHKVMGRWAAEWDGGIINLNPKKSTATDLLTILHELAHHVHWHFADGEYNEHQDHGAEFMACYLSILDTVRLIPRDAMATICERRGLKYVNPGPSVKSLKLAIRTKPARQRGAARVPR